MRETQDQGNAGAAYHDFMGRWSRLLASEFVSWLQIPAGSHWLDVGCGTGALTMAICRQAQPASVVGCDRATAFVDYARNHARHERASFVVADASSLPIRQGGYDGVTSLLALNFFPNQLAAVREMRSVSRPGATISACVWDYAGRMEFLRQFWDAATAIDPNASSLDEGVRFPICRPEPLCELFRAGGLADVVSDALVIPTRFVTFEDYWRPLLGATGPAPAYVASLDDDRREALASRLKRDLPRDQQEGITLVARGWAIRGVVR